MCLSKDCAVANVIYASSMLRYKGFKLYLKDKNIPMEMLPRYAGNHNVFVLGDKLLIRLFL